MHLSSAAPLLLLISAPLLALGRPYAGPWMDLDAPLTLHDLHHLSQLSALTSGGAKKSGAAAGGAPGGAAPAAEGHGQQQGGEQQQQAPPQRRSLQRRDLEEPYLTRRGGVLSIRDVLESRFVDLDAPLTLHDLHHLSRLSALTAGGMKGGSQGQGSPLGRRQL